MHPPRLLLALLLLAALAPGASAQVLRGQLNDADRARPVPHARLYLLDPTGAYVDSTFTDRNGRFRLVAPAPGLYSAYFQMDGWASMTSDTVRLAPGQETELDFQVTVIGNEALRQMGDIMALEPRLQSSLPEICGEAFRPWEAGLLIGVVRVRATDAPIAGARVSVASRPGETARSTITGENGVYILCNVPVGRAIRITAAPPDGAAETVEVEIRAGTASWYDLPLGPRRTRRR